PVTLLVAGLLREADEVVFPFPSNPLPSMSQTVPCS
ncbi:MAG: hypothetical protein ACI80M_000908, partial [Gammaproteobacteria bacterium]